MCYREGLSGRGGSSKQGRSGANGWKNADEKIRNKKKVGKRSKRKRGRKPRRQLASVT